MSRTRLGFTQSSGGETLPQQHALKDDRVAIEYDTFVRNVDRDDLATLAHDLGYGQHYSLRQDFEVGYYRSRWRGRTCYYLDHSGFQYIFANK